MKTQKFRRKPFNVDGVQVTAQNIQEVQEWTNGELVEEEIGKWYIKIDVKNALNERQSKAYIGDWVLKLRDGFKVYTDKSFWKSFEKSK